MSFSLKHLGFKPIDVILVVTWYLLQKQNPTVNSPGFPPPFVTFIYVLFSFNLYSPLYVGIPVPIFIGENSG